MVEVRVGLGKVALSVGWGVKLLEAQMCLLFDDW